MNWKAFYRFILRASLIFLLSSGFVYETYILQELLGVHSPGEGVSFEFFFAVWYIGFVALFLVVKACFRRKWLSETALKTGVVVLSLPALVVLPDSYQTLVAGGMLRDLGEPVLFAGWHVYALLQLKRQILTPVEAPSMGS